MAMAAPELIEVRWQAGRGATAVLPPSGQAMLSRVEPLLQLGRKAVASWEQAGLQQGWLALQLHDEDPAVPCLRFDAAAAETGGPPLIPDPYALASHGFAALRTHWHRQPLPAWRERLNQAIWRGSSTGFNGLSLHNEARHQRLQLCRWSVQHPALLDARLTALVQTAPGQSEPLHSLLHGQRLMAPRLHPSDLALHRWLIEIDGNVNSWGLLWKLLSGSCVLRVSSPRRQWYHHRLVPWQHFIPIAADLSDLGQQLEWCRSHPAACEQVAQAGQRLAQAVVAELEQDQQRAFNRWTQEWMEPADGTLPPG